jgi:hypothetical protein
MALTGKFGRALLVAAATMVAFCWAGGDAYALSYSDILGNWCSATAQLEFTRENMGVLLFADKSHSSARVSNYEFVGKIVTVHWYKDGKLTSSDFGEFSADGRTMFLQPGDDVPHREYHRC